MPLETRRALVSLDEALSVRSQCQLLGLDRSGLYYEPAGESAENLSLMRRLDELHTAHPFYGVRKMGAVLEREGFAVNLKRVRRLLRLMGLMSVAPRPSLSRPALGAQVFPYLLRGLFIGRAHQVLGHRHYLYSLAWRLPLSGCRPGLVEPLRAGVGTVQ
ncbi:hypothetical protein BH20VER1_BH20VER1_18810 [soil metagenome]